ncbi:hypothetical protein CC80DRAFT_32273 [Byssothecium circinans]|uniref:Uncharacterized protein n=1 Tax=Byssothecium circinans TaxID=147558 RepID=A0A6A5TXW3_9PLEO|nr:hypothetical protein CC80DRAFT_32273 [Byssothecium circinans]
MRLRHLYKKASVAPGPVGSLGRTALNRTDLRLRMFRPAVNAMQPRQSPGQLGSLAFISHLYKTRHTNAKAATCPYSPLFYAVARLLTNSLCIYGPHELSAVSWGLSPCMTWHCIDLYLLGGSLYFFTLSESYCCRSSAVGTLAFGTERGQA